MNSAIRVGLIGDYRDAQRAHQAIPKALQAVSDVECVWIPTESAETEASLAAFDGLWCVPGMPYRSAAGAMHAIRHARTTRTPFLGTSAGFQYAILEFARNVVGLRNAEHQKTHPKAEMPLISPLPVALAGVQARVHLLPGSHLRRAYDAPHTTEEYHCSFGLNGKYRRLLEGKEMYVAAIDDQQNIRAVELDSHPFFVATLFQPELREGANPVVREFVHACAKRRNAVARMAG